MCADLKSKICVNFVVKSSFIEGADLAEKCCPEGADLAEKWNGLFIEGTKEGIITNTGELQLDCKKFSVFRQN